MDKALIAATLKKVRDNSPKKNFKQSLDLIMNLKGLDLKKPEHQVNIFVTFQYGTGKNVSVCALVEPDLASKAKEACDETITIDQFERFKSKAEAKKLANKYDFFIAQSSIMPKVATTFGRYLGPRGKMPNPKIGSVLTPASNIKQLCDQLKRTVLLVTKNEPTIKCRIGNEDTKDDEAIDNILAVYNSVAQKLPNDKQNIKSVMLKLTMGHSFAIGAEEEVEVKPQGREKAKAKEKGVLKEEKAKAAETSLKEAHETNEKRQEIKPKSRKRGK
ncbi:50S ribosomal protein L1 [Candidatus Woesearchaeota archaeon]|nr:50S ribosomal protein L1 [Candidatus Woesearchaeota archaeon]